MDILKRTLAPITDAAWTEIDEQARRTLTAFLSARKVVDTVGPMGDDFAGVAVGRLNLPDNQDPSGVRYGVRQIHHLIETRISFDLDIWELDNVVRGAKDIDLDNLEEACKKAAVFEENAVYHGFDEANIGGLKMCKENVCLTMGDKPEEILEGVTGGLTVFNQNSVEGPYTLVVGPKLWSKMSAHVAGFPVRTQVENIMGGPVVLSPYLEEHGKEAYLISSRGGDLELILGQDLSVGYEKHDHQKVTLFVTETFTFRVLEPKAVVYFESK